MSKKRPGSHPKKRKQTPIKRVDSVKPLVEVPSERAREVSLSSEVLQKIFLHLNFADVLSCERVCWHWKNAADDGTVWKKLLRSDFRFRELSSETQLVDSWKEIYQNFYRFEKDKPGKLLSTNSDSVISVAFSNSGKYLVCSTSDKIMVWDVENNFSLLSKVKHWNRKNFLEGDFCFEECDRVLLAPASSESGENRVILYDFPTLKNPRHLTLDKKFQTENGSTIAVDSFKLSGWLDSRSFLVEVNLGFSDDHISDIIESPNILNRTCYICSIDAACKPTFVFKGYRSTCIVNNTETGRKHIIVQASKENFFKFISLEIEGFGGNLVSLIEGGKEMELFKVQEKACEALYDDFGGFETCDMVGVGNRVYIHFGDSSNALPSVNVYTAELVLITAIHLGLSRPLTCTRKLKKIIGVETMLLDCCRGDTDEEKMVALFGLAGICTYLGYSFLLHKQFNTVLVQKNCLPRTTKIQPRLGRWVAAVKGSGVISCWRI